jgi:hypothetical protein
MVDDFRRVTLKTLPPLKVALGWSSYLSRAASDACVHDTTERGRSGYERGKMCGGDEEGEAGMILLQGAFVPEAQVRFWYIGFRIGGIRIGSRSETWHCN